MVWCGTKYESYTCSHFLFIVTFVTTTYMCTHVLFLPILLKRTSEVHTVHTTCELSCMALIVTCSPLYTQFVVVFPLLRGVCVLLPGYLCCCCGWLNVILLADQLQLRFRDFPTAAPVENRCHTATPLPYCIHQSRNSGSRGGANPFSNSYAPIALGQVSHPEVIGQYGQQRPISLSPLSQCNKKC